MTPRALSFVAVALLAVGASAAVVVSRTWAIRRGDATLAEVRETPSGVSLRDWTDKFAERELTKDEAASLGRALLEAAGQPEKPCAATWPPASSLNTEQSVCSCEAMVGGKCYCSKIGELKP